MSETLNAKLTEMLQKDHMMNSEEMRVINCRGRFITIENNEILLSLLACRDAEQTLLQLDSKEEERVLSGFASVFDAYDRCLRHLSAEKDKLTKSNGGIRLTEINLLFLLEKFFKQRRSVERNVLLLRSYLNERKEGGAVNSNNVIALSSCVR